MIQDIILPDELSTAIASESKDFIVKGRLAEPVGKPIFNIIFGTFWLSITFFVGTGFNLNLFSVEGIKEIIESVKNAISTGTYYQLIFLVAFFGIFVAIGLNALIKGIIPFFKRGGYFIGTPRRLLNFKKGKMYYTNWDQFTGKIRVRGNDKRGTLIMDKTTGYMYRNKSGSTYVPYTVYISGIQDVHEIEQICRRRIKESKTEE
jgi:hypothetical protein